MKFDWYQTTIHHDPMQVLSTISKLGHEVRPNDGIAKAYRYKQGFEVHHHQRGVIATVLMGGNGDHPHAWATSDDAPAFADLVRNEWPDHHLVTRLDAAEDFVEAGAYERLRKVCRKVAKGHRLRFSQQADELNPMAGRTQYIGSPQSDYRGRLYEKGFEMVGKLDAQLQALHLSTKAISSIVDESTGRIVNPSDWIRLELQARPKQEDGRRKAAYASPEQAWTFTSWTNDLAKEALALDLERYYVRTRKISKDDAAMRWMCKQYASMLRRQHDDLGSWDMVGREIARVIQEVRNRE